MELPEHIRRRDAELAVHDTHIAAEQAVDTLDALKSDEPNGPDDYLCDYGLSRAWSEAVVNVENTADAYSDAVAALIELDPNTVW